MDESYTNIIKCKFWHINFINIYERSSVNYNFLADFGALFTNTFFINFSLYIIKIKHGVYYDYIMAVWNNAFRFQRY